MSRSEDADPSGSGGAGTHADSPVAEALGSVEGAVRRLVHEVDGLRRRNQVAESRIREVEDLLRRFTKGGEDPARLQARIQELKAENDELRGRLEEGREAVERLQARLRFLEDRR